MKTLVALFVFGFCVNGFVMNSFADTEQDTAVTETVEQIVVERMSCDEIQARIKELGAVEEPDTATVDEITKLKADYRRICSRVAGNRRTSAAGRVIINNAPSVPEENTETEELISDDDMKQVEELIESVTAIVEEEGPSVPEVPELTLEQELANLEAGLCEDGTAPNKYGCCADEIFKDLGNTVFACCPKDGVGDCLPPLK